jgi:hypothetical protein
MMNSIEAPHPNGTEPARASKTELDKICRISEQDRSNDRQCGPSEHGSRTDNTIVRNASSAVKVLSSVYPKFPKRVGGLQFAPNYLIFPQF